jgi:hypothetical protein
MLVVVLFAGRVKDFAIDAVVKLPVTLIAGVESVLPAAFSLAVTVSARTRGENPGRTRLGLLRLVARRPAGRVHDAQ